MDRGAHHRRGCGSAELIIAAMNSFQKLSLGMVAMLLAGTAKAQINCIQIDAIDVTGVTLLRDAEVDRALDPFRGECLDIDGINNVLEAVTFLYVDKGYVTARAYLPEQNIADRSLDITVIEGTLAGIRFNGDEKPIWQDIVFPNLVGKSANLREIEQGLEIIRGMPAYNATMEISAGEQQGESILDVTAIAERPWTARVGIDNQGTPDRGQYQGTLNLTYDHLLGLNESWALDLSRGTEAYPFSRDTGGAATDNAGLSVRFPYGRWSFEASYDYSRYETDTLGPISTIGTDGWTKTGTIGVSRVMHRNQDSKTSLSTTLERRENVNLIAEFEIVISSRSLASERIDFLHDRTCFGVSVVRPWQTGAGQVSYSGTLRGQYSEDDLYGNYQFAIGGFSTVRGIRANDDNDDAIAPFSGISSGNFSGSSGAYLRNDIFWGPDIALPTDLGRLQAYLGLDAGISDIPGTDFSPTLVGSAIGLRLAGGSYSADFSWQQLLRGPDDITLPDGFLAASLSARF